MALSLDVVLNPSHHDVPFELISHSLASKYRVCDGWVASFVIYNSRNCTTPSKIDSISIVPHCVPVGVMVA